MISNILENNELVSLNTIVFDNERPKNCSSKNRDDSEKMNEVAMNNSNNDVDEGEYKISIIGNKSSLYDILSQINFSNKFKINIELVNKSKLILDSKLGDGSYCCVFNIENMNGKVLKVCSELKKSYLQEIHNIDHPNIEKIYSFIYPNIINNYISERLYSNFDNYKTTSKNNVVNILKQLYGAINFIHCNLKIVHGDIACRNVMFSDLHKEKIVLIDWNQCYTRENIMEGDFEINPEIMCPELFLINAHVNNRNISDEKLVQVIENFNFFHLDMWQIGMFILNISGVYEDLLFSHRFIMDKYYEEELYKKFNVNFNIFINLVNNIDCKLKSQKNFFKKLAYELMTLKDFDILDNKMNEYFSQIF